MYKDVQLLRLLLIWLELLADNTHGRCLPVFLLLCLVRVAAVD
jgi:hypothetical protein